MSQKIDKRGNLVVRINAGLGNQQFQYAFAKALSLKLNKQLLIDTSYFYARYHPVKNQGFLYPYRLSNFNVTEDQTTGLFKEYIGASTRYKKIQRLIVALQKIPLLNKLWPTIITHTNFDFDKAASSSDTQILSGFWQKFDIIEEYADEIASSFDMQKEVSQENIGYFDDIKSSNSVSVHFRRGDYVNNPNVVANYARLSPEYFQEAINTVRKHVGDDIKLFVFSDDIIWVEKTIKFDCPVVFVKSQAQDYEDQFLMSSCKHNIISNSTFSWWAGWLNKNPEKVVVAPEIWFASPERKDDIYYPSSWKTVGKGVDRS